MSKVQTRAGLGAAITAVQNDSNLDTLAGINEQQTGAYTIIIDDQNRTIEVDSATPVIITLTTIATLLLAAHTSDFQMTIKNIGAGAATITPTTDTFDDGDATKVLSQYEAITLQTDSTEGLWNVISDRNLTVPSAVDNVPLLTARGELKDGGALVDLIYPVGSIYLSTAATNPGTLFGGTWSQIAAGRTILGEGGAYTAGATAGSKDAVNIAHTHTFSDTSTSNGAHTHTVGYDADSEGATRSIAQEQNGDAPDAFTKTTSSNGAHTHDVSGTTSEDGVAGTDLNMMPYLVTYIWERDS